MRRLWIISVLLITLIFAFAFREKAMDIPTEKTEKLSIIKSPVLVELFTSQGCSSCPPADVVLAKLVAENEAGQSSVIALSYHVDYWNRLGWRDPYSQAAFSDRQRQYAQKLQDSRVYTPQIIVHGQSGHVGSREREIKRAIVKHQNEILPVQIEASIIDNKFNYTLQGGFSNTILNLVIVEKEIANDVLRGENKGKNLHHKQVVRWMKSIHSSSLSGEVLLPDNFDVLSNSFSIIAFVQDANTWNLLGIIKQ